ncbi:cytochrome b5, putative [Trypanosoma brucei gambiense DAL972]|uniref:Cytochrome b5, putative n=2 Tax=Trypanosoma brucei TaxID=5691 RepID=D0A9Q4_TRYB9|nr:cytochrome b5, putative [Trypanosoma brucei gambiense DAL972]RHW67465.1 cytochrome b5 [Trypanosoma brucei equiperdum]CBH18405.1 cytochrome b5, putative [Trypanosoma brucei gambiense DAL972]|eukprot:XP_011780669.1 cytochrome b5, putative [Trypanosoma brucei gambiense DAL972]
MEGFVSLKELQKHAAEGDLWISIDEKVYDVTKYVSQHPGGVDTLLGVAGKDGTDDFNSVGHSDIAKEELKKYCVGRLSPEDVKILKASSETSTTSAFSLELIAVTSSIVAIIIYFLFSS